MDNDSLLCGELPGVFLQTGETPAYSSFESVEEPADLPLQNNVHHRTAVLYRCHTNSYPQV